MEQNAHPTDLLPAYALDILDSAERAEVEAHLESCPECRAEVAAYRNVSNLLAVAVPQLEPADGTRRRLLEETRRESTTAEEAGNGRWWQSPGRAIDRLLGSSVWRPVLAGLILLLVISNIYFIYRLQQSGERPPEGEQTINLGGTDAAPEADGVLLIREGEPTGTLIVHGLPWLEPERQYQLWLVNDDGRVSGAVFSVEAEGLTSIEVSAPEPLPSYYRFGITIEPAGGSPGPTGDGVLRSAVDN